jgi:hypothetical protein
MALPALDFTRLGHGAAAAVRTALLGEANPGRSASLLDPSDLKSGHTVVDMIAHNRGPQRSLLQALAPAAGG